MPNTVHWDLFLCFACDFSLSFLIGFCVSQNETKRKVDFEDGGLISEDPAQLFAGSEGVDGRKAEIVPVCCGGEIGYGSGASVGGTSEQYLRQSLRQGLKG